MTTTTMQLHAALIWDGEPIADVVLGSIGRRAGPITIGPAAGATFTVPDLGLPEVFPIVRPGRSGYVVTLGQAMAGTLSIGGVRTDVGTLVGDAPFAATAVAPGDWGVVDLDGVGSLQLFFQVAPAVQKVAAGRVDVETWLPAAAFSVLLHLFLLIATYRAAVTDNAFVWPGPRGLTGAYLVSRIEPTPVPPPMTPKPIIVIGPSDPSSAQPEDTQNKPPRKADKDKQARAGKDGAPKVGDKDLRTDDAPMLPDVGFTSRANRDLLDRATNSPVDISKFFGTGRGHKGDGRGKDPRATDETPGLRHGQPDGKGIKKQDDLDTETGSHGHCKKGEKCKPGDGDGDGDGPPRTKIPPEVDLPPPDDIKVDGDDIDPNKIAAAIKSRKGVFRGCFLKSLNHGGSTGGTITMRFRIAPDGSVASATVESSTVHDRDMDNCVRANLQSIRVFPVSKNGAIVRYPFAFNGGS